MLLFHHQVDSQPDGLTRQKLRIKELKYRLQPSGLGLLDFHGQPLLTGRRIEIKSLSLLLELSQLVLPDSLIQAQEQLLAIKWV